MPGPKYSSWNAQEIFEIFALFKYYYNGGLDNQREKWVQAAQVLDRYATENFYSKTVDLSYLQRLAKNEVDEEEFAKVKHDFNNLFLGPGKLLAPPYESCYRNPMGLLMQQETLQVRKFYKMVGLEVADQGSMPDDHLVLELELICYLLSKAATSDKVTQAVEARGMYRNFLQLHLIQWLYDHCEQVIKNSQTEICKGMANYLYHFIKLQEELEQTRIGGMKVEG